MFWCPVVQFRGKSQREISEEMSRVSLEREVVVVVVVVVVVEVVAELLAVTGRDGHVGGNEITTIRSSIACVDLVSSHISIASGNPTTS